jgi:hypothetical protein
MMPYAVSIGNGEKHVYFWQPSEQGHEFVGTFNGGEVRGDLLCIRGLSKRELGLTELPCFAPVIEKQGTVALIGCFASISSRTEQKSSRINGVYISESPISPRD